jgi:hypothetical protein
MKSTFLVDTDLIIDHLNRIESARNILRELKPSGIAVIKVFSDTSNLLKRMDRRNLLEIHEIANICP